MPTAFLRNVRSKQLVYTLPLTDFTVVKTELPITLLRKSVFLKTQYPRTLTTTSTVTIFRDLQTRLVTTHSSAATLSVFPIGETRLTGLVLSKRMITSVISSSQRPTGPWSSTVSKVVSSPIPLPLLSFGQMM